MEAAVLYWDSGFPVFKLGQRAAPCITVSIIAVS